MQKALIVFHRWLALATSLFILILALTGSALVFEGAIDRGLNPQLWRVALPGLSNNWLVLLKDTSLVSVIAINDLMRQTAIAVGVTKQPFFFYLIACGIYLVFSMLSSAVFTKAEARANRGLKRVGGKA